MFEKSRKFVDDVKSEFNKVTWPDRQTTIRQTGVVLGISLVTAVFLGVVDYGLSELIKQVIG